MLTRGVSNPSITRFTSDTLTLAPRRHVFLIKPLTGQTHQIRVALKSLGAPVLGDPRYAAASAADAERAYLHAAAVRLPRLPELALPGEHLDIVCPPSEGSEFLTDHFCSWFEHTFEHCRLSLQHAAGADEARAAKTIWFAGTPVESF